VVEYAVLTARWVGGTIVGGIHSAMATFTWEQVAAVAAVVVGVRMAWGVRRRG
jgi:hypothetical protein